ncbi:ATP-dependent DNA helicase PIF1 [Zea mays]|uniref:ATP-dependent DNA helicase n=1 Tax=Zea mays TaxID=4577 RepID=A0A3L6FCY0_MAIZE|nr:ATP-dependent DNA helicase PIF1 [Zea mays]
MEDPVYTPDVVCPTTYGIEPYGSSVTTCDWVIPEFVVTPFLPTSTQTKDVGSLDMSTEPLRRRHHVLSRTRPATLGRRNQQFEDDIGRNVATVTEDTICDAMEGDDWTQPHPTAEIHTNDDETDEDNEIDGTQDESTVTGLPDPYDKVYNNVPEETHMLKYVPNCGYCTAKKFEYEPPGFCCRGGKVELTPLETPPQLQRLWDSTDSDARHFCDNIRFFNGHFSFTSLYCCLDSMTTNVRDSGIYTFRAQGMMYHNIKSFGREGGAEHKHLELYFYDDDPNLKHRYRKCHEECQQKDKDVIKQLVGILHGNLYSEHLRSTGHVENLDDYRITLNLDQTLNQKTYNTPLTSEVGVSMAKWMHTVRRIGQVMQTMKMQQFAVDMYIKIESSRLDFIRKNQDRLRADLYQSLVDSMLDGDIRAEKVGKRTVLSPSFIGDPRDMRRRYMDAMDLVRKFEKPDIFLTMTCNPNWDEIRTELLPGQTPQDRPDLVVRVFHAKLQELKHRLTKHDILGKVWAYVYVVEFQKRGLPHAHFLLIMQRKYKLTCPEQYDLLISAEIPDKKYPELRKMACGSIKAVKYLFKYIYKGHDRASVVMRDASKANDDVDEIKQYRDASCSSIFPTCTWWRFTSAKWSSESSTVQSGKGKVWQQRKRDTGGQVGRIVSAHPAEGERYYLRVLLNHMIGATSYVDLRTIDGVTLPTFREAAERRGLLESDNTLDDCLTERALFQMPSTLRRLFATILVYCELSDVVVLWRKHLDAMSEDYQRRSKSKTHVEQMVLIDIRNMLQSMGKDIKTFPLPPIIDAYDDAIVTTREVYEEESIELASTDVVLKDSLNEEQMATYDKNMSVVNTDQGGLFFVDGPGGTGKTYLYRVLLVTLRNQGNIAVATATSGVAASIMPGGRTAHSRFKIPLTIDDDAVCSFTKQSGTAELLRKSSLIIWDEASMTKRQAVEALDNSMHDIMGRPGLPFGGKTIVFGGDFRQVLPVIRKGSRAQMVASSLRMSYLWESMSHLKLVSNMRAKNDPWFAEYLLRVGGGTEVTNSDGDIHLPDEVCVPYSGSDNDLDNLIDFVFPNLNEKMSDSTYITSRAILSTWNDWVDMINAKMIDRFQGEHMVYHSFDSAMDDPHNYYPPEFLNTLTPNGLHPHVLKLKIGCPVILLRNIDPVNGLCNGTRLVSDSPIEHKDPCHPSRRWEEEVEEGCKKEPHIRLWDIYQEHRLQGGSNKLDPRTFPLHALTMVIVHAFFDVLKLKGLANYCVPAGEAYQKALDIAYEITQKGTMGIRMAKKAINEGAEVADMSSALAIEGECYEQLLYT